jgi:hypothetical protein
MVDASLADLDQGELITIPVPPGMAFARDLDVSRARQKGERNADST